MTIDRRSEISISGGGNKESAPSRRSIHEVFQLEDNEALAGISRRFWAGHGVVTTRAEKYPQAEELIGQRLSDVRAGLKPPFDLALLDYDVPGGSGVEVAGLIQGAFPGLPIVLFTGRHIDDTDIGKLTEQGIRVRYQQKRDMQLSHLDQIKVWAEKILNNDPIEE